MTAGTQRWRPPRLQPCRPTVSKLPDVAGVADFAAVSKLIDDAIAADKLPGAVLLIGHGGTIAFHQAYGLRKLAGEPGLDGLPAPAEPMTEDTIFDLASLAKILATSTAVMQLYEQGKLRLTIPCSSICPTSTRRTTRGAHTSPFACCSRTPRANRATSNSKIHGDWTRR